MCIVNENLIEMYGKIKSKPKLDHVVHGEKFYKMKLEVPRKSEEKDNVEVILPEAFLQIIDEKLPIFVSGQVRTYNKIDIGASKLELVAFTQDIENVSHKDFNELDNANEVVLEGFLCKSPNRRKTPMGRDICDMVLAVNRRHGRADYIPIICWGRNAVVAAALGSGDKIKVKGRMQSREYSKKNEDGIRETKVAYEISVGSISVLEKKKFVCFEQTS